MFLCSTCPANDRFLTSMIATLYLPTRRAHTDKRSLVEYVRTCANASPSKYFNTTRFV